MDASRKPKRVLMVDDEETTLFAVTRQFGTGSITLDTARTKDEALALLRQHPYDTVITDLRLTGTGGQEGLEILQHVKQHTPGTKVVLVTAYGNPELAQKAIALGASACMEKPVHFDTMRRTLKSLGVE